MQRLAVLFHPLGFCVRSLVFVPAGAGAGAGALVVVVVCGGSGDGGSGGDVWFCPSCLLGTCRGMAVTFVFYTWCVI